MELSAQSFGDRLNYLIATVHPRGQGPYTDIDLAAKVRARGVKCTSQYFGQLRKGRYVPSLEVAAAIAFVFGVSTDYFSDPDVAQSTDEQLAFVAALRDAGVTSVALRAVGLSADGLADVHAVIDQIRAREGLPAAQPDSPETGQPAA